MNRKRAAIIGAGIAGLSAGCYLQMNGYDTEIFEAHSLPGGLCTAWKRKGYIIEGCMHGLLGSSPSHPLYKLWSELIDIEKIRFVNFDIKHVFDFGNGRQFVQYTNLDKLGRYMKEISPEDADIVEEFIRDIRQVQNVRLSYDKPKEFFDLPGKLKMLRSLPLLFVIRKWLKISAEEFSKRFKNPFLQEVVKYFSSPVLFEMFVLAEMDQKRCGYPAIGSLGFSRLFEQKYTACGGKIYYNKRVTKIIVQEDKAVGIELDKKEKYYADIIISAADGRTTIYEMLGGRYLNDMIRQEYTGAKLNPSKIQVSLGINRNIENLPLSFKIILDSPLVISDGNRYNTIEALIYNDVKELSSENKTLVVIQLNTANVEYWSGLKAHDKEKYRAEKEKVANDIISILDDRIGETKEFVDMVDIATPTTYVNYTGNWKGSTQGWANENIFRSNPFKKELPGLKNFYMAGQWVEPGGGVPNAFKSGRDLAQIICRKDRIKFKSVLIDIHKPTYLISTMN